MLTISIPGDGNPISSLEQHFNIRFQIKNNKAPKFRGFVYRRQIDDLSLLICNVEIHYNFSFANVPFEEAEHIIEIFRGRGRDKKPLIVEAKGKEKSSSKKNFRSGAPRRSMIENREVVNHAGREDIE
jgi:hypothetical protein